MKLVVANWKLNPETEGGAIGLARLVDAKNVVIAPPLVFLSVIKKVLKKAKLGAQDVFWEEKGAYTGEVSSTQLKNIGVKYIIIGHSERRALGETDETINKKLKAALVTGLIPILCVGEPIRREKGKEDRGKRTGQYIKNQLKKDLKGLSSFHSSPSSLIIAYEPIWAIGTGESDSPENAARTAYFIKNFSLSTFHFSPKVLYGGSVNAQNAKQFLEKKEIDGFLVGGASLKPEEFKKIIKLISNFQ